MSIRKDLMDSLGLTFKEVNILISMFAKNNEGKVNASQIESDVTKIATSMIYNIGKIYNDYDVAHELINCGKDRQEAAIRSLLEPEDENLVLSYLQNRYYENVNDWVFTFYHAAQNQLLKILDGGIDTYRDFVDGLPYKNINRIASTLQVENEIAEFLAKYGQLDDFEQFMTDVQPVKDKNEELMQKYVANYTGKTVERKLPPNLSAQVFEKIQKQMQEHDTVSLHSTYMMNVLFTISRNKQLSPKQKEHIQTLFIEKELNGGSWGTFDRLVRLEKEAPYEILIQYLENSSNPNWDAIQFFDERAIIALRSEIMNDYNQLLTMLDREIRKNPRITPEQIWEVLQKSPIAIYINSNGYDIALSPNEETGKATLEINCENPLYGGDNNNIDIQIDGTALYKIIDAANTRSINQAEQQLEEFAQAGMGEVSVVNNTTTECRFCGYNYSEDYPCLVGAIGEDEHAPYIIGGQRSNNGFTDLKVKYPYSIINNGLWLRWPIEEMTPEQIVRFNKKRGTVDIEIGQEANCFTVDGETYITKHFSEGFNYNIKKKCSNDWMPICDGSRNSDGRYFAELINQNPNRFSKFLDDWIKENKNRNVGAVSLEYLCRALMQMPTETQLIEMEKDANFDENQFLNNLVTMATQKQQSSQKLKDAHDLLSEFKGITEENQEKHFDD